MQGSGGPQRAGMGSSVRSIYNRARYWAERVEMMSWWAGQVLRHTNGGESWNTPYTPYW